MREGKEVPKTSDHETKEPVIILHGTFAAAQTWWRPGSAFCEKLNAALAKRGAPARCWDGLEERAEEFKWSGLNSEFARTLAAIEIQRRLYHVIGIRPPRGLLETKLLRRSYQEVERTNPSRVHVIAHSHGGNVILKALSRPPPPSEIGSVVLLGTPLYHYSSRSPGFSLRNVIRSVFGHLSIAMVFLVFPVTAFYLFDLDWLVPFASPFWNWLFLAIMLLPTFMNPFIWEKRRAHCAQTSKMASIKVYHFQSRFDEAISLLKQCIGLGKGLSLKMAGENHGTSYLLLARLEFYLSILTQGEKIIRPWGVLRPKDHHNLDFYRQANYTKTKTPYIAEAIGRGLWAVSQSFVFAIACVDACLGKAVMLSRSYLRDMAARRGLAAIGRIALGDDSAFESIMSVGRSNEFYLKILCVDLPESVEERFAMLSKDYFSRIAAAVYRPEANYVQTPQLAQRNLVGAVETALADMGITHCQYYQDEWCIERIAELIADSADKSQGA